MNMVDNGKIFEKLLQLANNKGIIVRFAPLQGSYGRIRGDINVIESHSIEDYEEQADRVAQLLLHAMSICLKESEKYTNETVENYCPTF